jgi:hypothetical integral membrane protein (TIGR02206 family)
MAAAASDSSTAIPPRFIPHAAMRAARNMRALRRGSRMPSHFHAFGPSHWTAMVIMLAVSAVLVALARAMNSTKVDTALRYGLAVLLLADWIVYLGFFYAKGWITIGNILPLNLCDWATIAVTVTLIRPNQTSFELSYFWALAGTLLASVTPDLEYDFPDIRFILFFFYHAIIITSVLYMTFGLKMHPVAGSIARVAAWTIGYVAVAGTVDWLLGTNYGFLRAKPAVQTLFNSMPPWPWYIAESFAIGLLAMAVLYAPYALLDRLRQTRTAA